MGNTECCWRNTPILITEVPYIYEISGQEYPVFAERVCHKSTVSVLHTFSRLEFPGTPGNRGGGELT